MVMIKILQLQKSLNKLNLTREARYLSRLIKISQERSSQNKETQLEGSGWFYHTIVSGDNIEKIAKNTTMMLIQTLLI